MPRTNTESIRELEVTVAVLSNQVKSLTDDLGNLERRLRDEVGSLERRLRDDLARQEKRLEELDRRQDAFKLWLIGALAAAVVSILVAVLKR